MMQCPRCGGTLLRETLLENHRFLSIWACINCSKTIEPPPPKIDTADPGWDSDFNIPSQNQNEKRHMIVMDRARTIAAFKRDNPQIRTWRAISAAMGLPVDTAEKTMRRYREALARGEEP